MHTGREAINALLRREKVDHVPFYDSIWGETALKWVTQGMPANPDGKPVSSGDHFGIDLSPCGGYVTWISKIGQDEVLEFHDDLVPLTYLVARPSMRLISASSCLSFQFVAMA